MLVSVIHDRGGDGWVVLPHSWLADEEGAVVASVGWFYLAREHYAPIEDEL